MCVPAPARRSRTDGRGPAARGGLLLVLLVLTATDGLAAGDIVAGMPLREALQELRRDGLDVVFSSRVVTAGMRVATPPSSADPGSRAGELLAPHGLTLAATRSGTLVVVAAPSGTPPAPPVSRALRFAEEIVVQPSRFSLLAGEPASVSTLDREEIEALPHLGDDIFRTLALLPGTASSGATAEFHIRGGRRDEMLVLLDGQELYEPYHLRDFDNALSIVAASSLERVDLLTAAFPVVYGDRMAGVLDMATRPPREDRLLRLSLDLFGARVDAGDVSSTGAIGWIASLRRGTTDLLGRLADYEDPRFWDGFGRAGVQLGPRHSFHLHALASGDALDFVDDEDGGRFTTEYENGYGWLTHRADLGSRMFVDTSVSATRMNGDRRGAEEDDERAFAVHDVRRTTVRGLSQAWTLAAGERQILTGGFEIRRFETRYQYASSRQFFTPLIGLRAEPREGTFAADASVRSENTALWLSDRFRPRADLTLEAGLRYDSQTAVDDSSVSPRLSAAWAVGERDVVRAAWGRFVQSQRSYELMVEDGDLTLYRAERSQHWAAGFEHRLADSSPLPLSSFRVELYRREVANPRPRYENLFDPFDAFPEGEFDRVRIEPERATAQGIELMLRGRPSERVQWWLDCAMASARDRIAGDEVPRSFDQRFALNLDVQVRLDPHWTLNAALLSHSGWPITTPALDSSPEEEPIPVLGPLNGDRLPAVHRIDLRISREWAIAAGRLSFFVEGHNLAARRNVAGVDVTLDEETGEIEIAEDHLTGPFATAGVVFRLRGGLTAP